MSDDVEACEGIHQGAEEDSEISKRGAGDGAALRAIRATGGGECDSGKIVTGLVARKLPRVPLEDVSCADRI